MFECPGVHLLLAGLEVEEEDDGIEGRYET